MQRCPDCQAELESALGCSACGTLFDPPAELSPFELFGLAPGFALDERALEKRLRATMRLVHPDVHGAAPAEQRERAERASARLNGAYATLADPLARADWLVGWLGGPSESQQRSLPQQFLHEVLEWNELLEEARAGARPALDGLPALQAMLLSRRSEALQTAERLLSPLPARGAPRLAEVRAQLNAMRYFERTLSEIEALGLARASAR
jgi:DnaJ-domain-containing protein 1